MKKKIQIFLIIIFFLAVALWLYYANRMTKLEHSNNNIIADKILTVGISADYPPFEFQQNGEVVGYDIDLINIIGEKLGVKIEIKDMDFNAIIPSLKTGLIEVAISSLNPNEERKKSIDFTDSYYETSIAFVYKTGNYKTLSNLAGKKVAVQLGSTMEQFIKDSLSNIPNISLSSYSRIQQMVMELKLNKVDVLILDHKVAEPLITKYQEFNMVSLDKPKLVTSIGLAKNSPLTPMINEIIKNLKSSGEMEKLEEKWLN